MANKIRKNPPRGIRRKPKHGMAHGGSSTTGKSKGMIPNPMYKSIAKRGRSWKDPNYSEWCKKYNGDKVRGNAQG